MKLDYRFYKMPWVRMMLTFFQSVPLYIKYDALHETKDKEVVSWSGYK